MAILEVRKLSKIYDGGFQALKEVDLTIRKGEIFALLGPNGAGKTTLINAICGIVNPTSGEILVDGFDIFRDFRKTRAMIGLVPQELTTDLFETVWDTVSFSRGLFGKPPNPEFIERTLRQLSLWDKKDNMLKTLSGGMKRRVMIAKALSHEPRLLFLDEPTAGVDVSLRQSMWEQVRDLQRTGVTIVLTTHYIHEAEEMAERVGVINHGEIIVTEAKDALMKKLGRKRLILDLEAPLETIPPSLKHRRLELDSGRTRLTYTYDSSTKDNGIADLMSELCSSGVSLIDINTESTSLEQIFVELVRAR